MGALTERERAARALGVLRILVVDDEPLARARLARLVAECDAGPDARAEVVGEAGDAAQALAWLDANDCDLLLLDIRMPGQDGLRLAAALERRMPPVAVVFVTAHAGHAVAAFETEAVDYLTKPVRRERLEAALRRVAARRAPPPPVAVSAPVVLVVHEAGRVVRIPAAEVLYLKAELKYVTLRTAERAYLLDDALSDLERRLGESFLRVHRNALVARGALRALERRAAGDGDDGWAVRVHLVNEWLAVSRRQLAAVRDALARR